MCTPAQTLGLQGLEGPNDRQDTAAAPGEPHGSGVTDSFLSLLLKKNINSNNNNNNHKNSTNIHNPSESCKRWPFIPSRVLPLSASRSFNQKAPSCFLWAGTAAPLAWSQSSLRGCSGLPSLAGPWAPGGQGSQECLAGPLARLHPSCHNLEALEDLEGQGDHFLLQCQHQCLPYHLWYQAILSFLANPGVLLGLSDQGAQVTLEHLAALGRHPSLEALAGLELLPPPWGTASWRCSKPSSHQTV